MKKNSLWVLLERFLASDPVTFGALFKHIIIGELGRYDIGAVGLAMGLDDRGGLWLKADHWPKEIIFKDGPVAFLALLGDIKTAGDPDVFWNAFVYD